MEGLSEGLWYELGSFGIKVKLIEPGVTKTNFSGRSMDVLEVFKSARVHELHGQSECV